WETRLVLPRQAAAVPRQARKTGSGLRQEAPGGPWRGLRRDHRDDAVPLPGWNCRGPAKYRDLLLDVGTEEMGHVEMLATMIARLLEGSPVDQEEAARQNSAVGAVLGGMSP